MDMNWFVQLKHALPAYYPISGPADVVGYLRGSGDPSVWRSMERTSRRYQMIVLGSLPPTLEDWGAAGVWQRGFDRQVTVRSTMLAGFIVLYGGFNRRPWGHICTADADALKTFPSALASWQANYVPPRQ
jgi:hypothetical protein